MCGIFGLMNLNKLGVNRGFLESSTDALAERGPDGRGIWQEGFIGLGHRRLAVLDLSERAHQPMRTEDNNFVIIYNGETYNFLELKKELESEGVAFVSRSDAEVVLKSFAKWGKDCLNRFNGMFAFAIWDKRNSMLTLARDRYGMKPLYFWQNQKVFMFASEIKAFFKQPEFSVNLDQEALLEYFTFQNTFTHKTLFKGVRLLPAGSFMQLSLKKDLKIKRGQYWDFSFKQEKNKVSEQEYAEELDRLFNQAVKRQLVSDVEIGSYLSGGIDTTSITAVASQQFKHLKTFCIGFDLSSISGLELSFDEREKAESVSSLHKTEHYDMMLKSGDMKRCLPYLVWSLEDLRLGQSYPNFYASKLASRFVKVCLSGTGGDELFAGYPWRYYHAMNIKDFDSYIDGYYKYWHRLVPNRILKKLFLPIASQVKDVWTEDIFRNIFSNHNITPRTQEDYINHSLYFEAKTFLHGLLLVEDKLSMAHGLETRAPFLDNDLVDFAQKLPMRFKLKDIDSASNIDENELAQKKRQFERMQNGKIILRKALEKYAGSKIANQQKQGFSGPDASWFKGESINYVREILLSKKANIYNYFDYKTTSSIINEHINGKHNRRLFIWSLLCFEWWIKLFLKNDKIDNVFN